LFAIMGGSTATLMAESIVIAAFVLISILGFKLNLWLIVAAVVCSRGLRLHPRTRDPESGRSRMVAWVLPDL
jgi:hypothetical protein